MKMAASLIVPFLLSAFIAIISFPFMSRLQQTGMSKGIALTLVMMIVILVGAGLTILIGSSITDFSQMLPEYQQKISLEWSHNLQWLNDHGISVTDKIKELVDPAEAVGLISAIIKGFGNVLTNSFLILLTVIFILTEAAGLTQKALTLNGSGEDIVIAGDKEFTKIFVENLRNYMSMKTIISAVTGTFIGVMLWIVGVDYPVLWGVLAFMLNFVPNIGSIIAAVPAVLLTVVQLGFSSALLVAAIYIAVNIVIGSVIEPKYMGKGLGLSTLVVFISLVFWGWVLGPVGMLLSVPLTMTVKLALDSKPETQWLGHLLGPVD
ncbi:MAG TPA: AI-2E family transporter [Gammaproteobacteria bacterium]|nr:AI-2E family transporter [Gammaproteobacteria bacterium]